MFYPILPTEKQQLTGVPDFLRIHQSLRNVVIGQDHIYRKQMKKAFFPKMRHFVYTKKGS